MTLQVYTLALGNFRDDTSGNNYAANAPVYILNSGGTLADIFRDQAGAQPIVQDGLNNISDAYGEFTFYVNSGQYISRVAGRDRLINVVGSDYFDSRVDDAVEQITQQTLASRGFRVVGTFADGFTYELFNDVGIDSDGNSWIYVGTGAPNKTVSAGTVPSVGAGYQQVTFNVASGVINTNGGSVQDFIDSVGLKLKTNSTLRLESVFDLRSFEKLVVGDIVKTRFAEWEIVNSPTSVPTNYGLYAKALTPVSPRDYLADSGVADADNFQLMINNHDTIGDDKPLFVGLEKNVAIPVKNKFFAKFSDLKILCNGGYVPLTNANGVLYSSLLSTGQPRGSKYVKLSSSSEAANFSSGDLVQVRSNALWYYDNRGTAKKGETHIVKKVVNDTVYFKAALCDTYSSTETVNLVKLDKSKYDVSGINIVGVEGSDGGAQFTGLVKSNIKINIDGSNIIGLFLKNCYKTMVAGSFENVIDAGTGYGVQISQSSFMSVLDSTFANNRRGVDVSGSDAVSRYCSIKNCVNEGVSSDLYSVSSGFGSHGSSDFTEFSGNTCINVRQGFVTRGSNETVKDNILSGRMADAVASTYGSSLTIKNNVYRSAFVDGAPESGDSRLLNFVNIVMDDNRGRTIISGNEADRLSNSFLQISMRQGSNKDNVKGISMTGNQAQRYANTSSELFTTVKFVPTTGFSDITVKACKFKGNSVTSLFGGQVINYDPLIKFNLDTVSGANIVNGLLLNISDENGNITALHHRVFADINEQSIRVYGKLGFNFDSPASVKLGGFPTQRISDSFTVQNSSYGIGSVYLSFNGTSPNLGKFFLSSDQSMPTGNLVGGTHSIALDFEYEQDVARYVR